MCILLRDAPSLLLIQLLMIHYSLQMLHAFEKKLVSGNAGDEKNLHPGRSKFIFLIDFPEIFFFSLVSFAFLILVFSSLMFFEIKNVYSNTHSTIRAVSYKKFFTRPISRNKTTFFGLSTTFRKVIPFL